MDGLLLVDKPKGWTSFDVVAKVRGVLRQAQKVEEVESRKLKEESNFPSPTSHLPPPKIKVGHTGTLDPLATGLLVLAIGKYTKKVPELTKQDKAYEATMTLGATSTTDDAEGELTKVGSQEPSLQEVKEVLASFVGTIEQIPPQFSAIKIGGVKSYDAARKGKTVVYEPRTVTIHEIKDISYDYPTVTFTAKVGSGTYIRSLARDAGEKLGTGAFLSDLRRISVGEYDIKNAILIDGMGVQIIKNNLRVEK